MLSRCTAVVTLVAWCASARGEAPIVGGRTPRAIGRAGVGTVSDDGGGALLTNPAAIARRDGTRIQLGLAFVDDEMFYLASSSAPSARDQSSSRLLPIVSIEGAIHDWVFGIGAGTSVRSERVLRRPGRIPPSDFGNSFEYRYSGLAGSIRRDTLTLAGAHRLTDTIAFGLSLSTSRVVITESRRLWAGNVDRVVLGLPQPDLLGDPEHDLELAMSATDNFAPSAVAGVLVAPEESHIELGASVMWNARAGVTGDVASTGEDPTPSVYATTSGAKARLDISQPLTVRTGARWLGEHVIAEVGGDLYWFPERAQAAAWRFDGATVTDVTSPLEPHTVVLDTLPSRISSRTHG
ncbi:MAG TPA: outer membrane protein transport protein, partial [Kofleriaceae bacterium]